MALQVVIEEKNNASFKRYKYFNWTPGDHTIHLLDFDLKPVVAYWLGGGYVRSTNPDNPQEILNKKIRLENPQNFRNIRGYRPAQRRYIFRVYDKTVAKICPECGLDTKVEIGQTYPSVCSFCKKGDLTRVSAAPINDVRIVNCTVALVEQLILVDKTTLDENGNQVGIENLDLQLFIVGRGTNRQTVVKPGNICPIPISFDLEPLNVDNSIFLVSDSEMNDLIRGISLRDILLARSSKGAIEEITESLNTEEDVVKKKIDELFS